MPELTAPTGAEPRPVPDRSLGGYAADALVVLGWFVVVGVVGALIWWKVTPLAAYTRTKSDAVMPSTEFGKQVATDGWYFVIAAVGGLVSGVGLSLWRRRDPLTLVVLMLVGGVLAAWVMLVLGLHLGPADPRTVLKDLPVGGKASLQLKPVAGAVWVVWPLAALIGTLGILLGTRPNAVAEPGSG